MSDKYVTAKIREALEATNHDTRDAQKLVITWAMRDMPLLLGLAKPHLKALTLARIDEEQRKGIKKSARPTPKDIETIVMGHTKGEKRKPVNVPPPKSSKRQASVMHALAAAFKKKK